jgi:hypothetical protein
MLEQALLLLMLRQQLVLEHIRLGLLILTGLLAPLAQLARLAQLALLHLLQARQDSLDQRVITDKLGRQELQEPPLPLQVLQGRPGLQVTQVPLALLVLRVLQELLVPAERLSVLGCSLMEQRLLARKRMTCWLFQILARRQLLREQLIQVLAFFLVHLLRRLTSLITHHSLVVCGRFMHLLRINLVEAHFVSGLKCKKLRLMEQLFCKLLRRVLMPLERQYLPLRFLHTHTIFMSLRRHLPAHQAGFC